MSGKPTNQTQANRMRLNFRTTSLAYVLVSILIRPNTGFQAPVLQFRRSYTSKRTMALHMVQNRGLEVRREGATPTRKDTILFLNSCY